MKTSARLVLTAAAIPILLAGCTSAPAGVAIGFSSPSPSVTGSPTPASSSPSENPTQSPPPSPSPESSTNKDDLAPLDASLPVTFPATVPAGDTVLVDRNDQLLIEHLDKNHKTSLYSMDKSGKTVWSSGVSTSSAVPIRVGEAAAGGTDSDDVGWGASNSVIGNSFSIAGDTLYLLAATQTEASGITKASVRFSSLVFDLSEQGAVPSEVKIQAGAFDPDSEGLPNWDSRDIGRNWVGDEGSRLYTDDGAGYIDLATGKLAVVNLFADRSLDLASIIGSTQDGQPVEQLSTAGGTGATKSSKINVPLAGTKSGPYLITTPYPDTLSPTATIYNLDTGRTLATNLQTPVRGFVTWGISNNGKYGFSGHTAFSSGGKAYSLPETSTTNEVKFSAITNGGVALGDIADITLQTGKLTTHPARSYSGGRHFDAFVVNDAGNVYYDGVLSPGYAVTYPQIHSLPVVPTEANSVDATNPVTVASSLIAMMTNAKAKEFTADEAIARVGSLADGQAKDAVDNWTVSLNDSGMSATSNITGATVSKVQDDTNAVTVTVRLDLSLTGRPQQHLTTTVDLQEKDGIWRAMETPLDMMGSMYAPITSLSPVPTDGASVPLDNPVIVAAAFVSLMTNTGPDDVDNMHIPTRVFPLLTESSVTVNVVNWMLSATANGNIDSSVITGALVTDSSPGTTSAGTTIPPNASVEVTFDLKQTKYGEKHNTATVGLRLQSGKWLVDSTSLGNAN